jgi:hypothetical protein
MKLEIMDLHHLISCMNPVLNPGIYAFTSVPSEAMLQSVKVFASIHEAEGYSAILAEYDAIKLGLPILFRAAWITLEVHSDLQAVGLTAAFSSALAKKGISCNVVAGACHDHLFVPEEKAEEAMRVLKQLQRSFEFTN